MHDERKTQFRIKLEYFKPSGKFAYEGEFSEPFQDLGNEHDGAWHPLCYMNAVTDRVREMAAEGKLPGLSSGRWDGFIRVTCEEYGFPCLIVPEVARQALLSNPDAGRNARIYTRVEDLLPRPMSTELDDPDAHPEEF